MSKSDFSADPYGNTQCRSESVPKRRKAWEAQTPDAVLVSWSITKLQPSCWNCDSKNRHLPMRPCTLSVAAVTSKEVVAVVALPTYCVTVGASCSGLIQLKSAKSLIRIPLQQATVAEGHCSS